jgi:squalene-associated FAD-dependent desaturase
MKVAIIGAGWAGLSAAVRIAQHGHAVVVFEAARLAGGRARAVWSNNLDRHIDNGQHILLGAYTETLSLMKKLGLDEATLFHRERLTFETLDGQFRLQAAPLPAPLHLLSAILTARGPGFRERLSLVTLTESLRRTGWIVEQGLTVAQWLDRGRQSPHIVRAFWRPLCLAALNTPPESASAQLFANVLKDSVGSTADACDVLIPHVDLTQLWPAQVARYAENTGIGATEIRYGAPVRQLNSRDGHIDIDNEVFDGVVVAGNAPSTQRLLQSLPASEAGAHYLSVLSAFRFLPIATLTLLTEHRWPLSRPMLLLRDDPSRLHFGQWLFGCPSLLNIVISDARNLALHPRRNVVDGIIEQISEQGERFGPLPRITAHELIIDKRATFAAVPDLLRPANTTPWPRVWTAGDWTDTAYPGVLEGAVRSGLSAAQALMKSLS